MRFGRKTATSRQSAHSEADAVDVSEMLDIPFGPYDVEDIPEPLRGVQRVDLGSLLVAPIPGCELQVQIDETSGEIQAVMLVGEDGMLELRAFAAPRNGDLWAEVRPQLVSDVHARGGRCAEAEGTWGTHLLTELPVEAPDGSMVPQTTRMIGINGSRWMVRAVLFGRPATEEDAAEIWMQAIALSAVRRGTEAVPPGRALPLRIPADITGG